jgi:hypothetical protein
MCNAACGEPNDVVWRKGLLNPLQGYLRVGLWFDTDVHINVVTVFRVLTSVSFV